MKKEPEGPTPKYRVSAKRLGARAPHYRLWGNNMAERDNAVEKLAQMFPEDKIEVRLTKGLKHASTNHWVLVDGKLVEIGVYDQLADGGTVPENAAATIK